MPSHLVVAVSKEERSPIARAPAGAVTQFHGHNIKNLKTGIELHISEQMMQRLEDGSGDWPNTKLEAESSIESCVKRGEEQYPATPALVRQQELSPVWCQSEW